MPTIQLDRLNTTQNQIKKNAKIKTVINNKQFSIGTITLRTAKEELKLAEYVMHVKHNKNDICIFSINS